MNFERYKRYISEIEAIDLSSISETGGKGSALGELQKYLPNIKVPRGFIITTKAYLEFLNINGLSKKIQKLYSEIKKDDIISLQYKSQIIQETI
ncbi:MAG: phenylphosphate synthase subunit beta, partial [Candidatus Firestonebacteria bacterium]|nr:phenylphosphate synthase subunit beta [Candidatus Firestonebacteria bacterium]